MNPPPKEEKKRWPTRTHAHGTHPVATLSIWSPSCFTFLFIIPDVLEKTAGRDAFPEPFSATFSRAQSHNRSSIAFHPLSTALHQNFASLPTPTNRLWKLKWPRRHLLSPGRHLHFRMIYVLYNTIWNWSFPTLWIIKSFENYSCFFSFTFWSLQKERKEMGPSNWDNTELMSFLFALGST